MRTVLPLLVLFVVSSVEAQRAPIIRSHAYGPEHGLSNRHVTAVIQDNVGFIWAGTVSGLDRFDGHSFRNWSQIDGLRGGRVSALRKDAKGRIWVFCDSRENDIMHMDILDPATGSLRPMEDRFPALPFAPADPVRYGPQRADGSIVLGAAAPARCIVFDAHERFTIHTLPGERFEPLGDDQNQRTIGHLVGADGEQRIVRVSAQGAMDVVQTIQRGTIVENMVTGRTTSGALYRLIGPDGSVRFFDTYSELILIDRALLSDSPASRDGDPKHRPLNYTPLPEHGMLFEGTMLVDGNDRVLFDLMDEHPEVSGRVKGCIVDRSGDPWLTTEFGLFHIELRHDVFQRILHEPNVSGAMGLLCRGMAMRGEQLYLATEWQGARVLDLSGDTVKVQERLTPRYLFASHMAQDGSWWRAGDGVVLREDAGGDTTRFEVKDEIWNILSEVEGRVLLGGLHGLHLLDPRTGEVRSWNDPRHPELNKAHVMQLQRGSGGAILATTSNGLYECGPGGRVVRRWWSGAEGRERIPYHDLHHCYIDADGLMWLSTRGAGLVCFDPRKGTHQTYAMRNGFPNNMVYAAYEDGNGQLWLPTDGGIVRFDKRSRQATVFTTADGITNDEFNRLAHARGPDGTLYFGGLNGITAFHPDAFVPRTEKQRSAVVLTRFEGYSAEQGGVVDRLAEATATGGIVLGADDRALRISFALLAYEGEGRILYAWRLAGVEDEWNYQFEPTLRLDRLPFGEYTLEVMARNGMGYWSTHQLVLPITVQHELMRAPITQAVARHDLHGVFPERQAVVPQGGVGLGVP
ncbi:MAG: two-component regulator propeller domain-containing protein, partial [Flavobacteriales bacterium]